MYGDCPQRDFQASHRLGTGIVGIERDFNPNNLCWESDRVNKSRGFCQMFFETALMAADVNLTAVQQFTAAEQDAQVVCTIVHTRCMQPGDAEANFLCQFWDPAWGVLSPL
jgi:hypothetical protein